MKNQWSSRIKQAAITGLAALLGAVSGCSNNMKKPDIYVETALVSDYVAKHGVMVEGQVRQDLINVNFNDMFSGFVWQNYSYEESAFNERDFGISHSLPITDRFSIRGGYEYWGYPSGTFGDYDSVLKAGAHYSGKFDLDFELTHLLPTKTTPKSGNRYYWRISKKFPIGKLGKTDISLTPSLSTSVIENYYGKTGHTQVTPGVSLGLNKGNWNLNISVNKQYSQEDFIKDKTWGGVSLGYKF